MDNKLKRARKWTADELEILITCVEEKKTILFSALNDTITNKLKRKMWEEITQRVNSDSVLSRPMKEVKKKWMDYKCQTRKRAADLKRGMKMTGGGKMPTPLSDTELKVVSLIPPCQIEGCAGGLESEEIQCTLPAKEQEVVPMDADLLQPQEWPEDGHEADAMEIVAPPSTYEEDKVASKTRSAKASSSGKFDSMSEILCLETEKVKILRDFVQTEKQRLDVEKERLEVEKQRLEIEKQRLEIDSLKQFLNVEQ